MKASVTIRDAMQALPGVTSGPHQFGAVEFLFNGREIGHLHGDHVLDVPFPRRVKDALIAAGEAEEHRFVPDSGWVSFRLKAPGDAEHAIAPLRRSHELIQAQVARRLAQSAAARARQDGK